MPLPEQQTKKRKKNNKQVAKPLVEEKENRWLRHPFSIFYFVLSKLILLFSKQIFTLSKP